MANNTKSINTAIFKFLKSRGLRPVSLNSDGKKIPLPADADVFRFKIKNDIDGDADSGFGSSIVSVSVDEDGILKIYYDSDAIENPSFTKLLGQLKQIANRRQLDFDPVPDDSEDELKHDMAKRKEMNKNKLSEGSKSVPADKTKQKTAGLDLNALRTAAKTATPASSLPKKGVTEAAVQQWKEYKKESEYTAQIPKKYKDAEDSADGKIGTFYNYDNNTMIGQFVRYDYTVFDGPGKGWYTGPTVPGTMAEDDELTTTSNLHWSKELRDREDPHGKRTKLVPGRKETPYRVTSVDPSYTKSRIKSRMNRDGITGPRGVLPEDQRIAEGKIVEGYYPSGRLASYSDAVPTIKIVLQHTRAIAEGEARYRNISKIFLENEIGERIACPTNRPGIARAYARLLAEGDKPYGDRWNHINSILEDYNKIAGFVRATRSGVFSESTGKLIELAESHYLALRETLKKLGSHRGYTTYFDNWSPVLNENADDADQLTEIFTDTTLDPRIEAALPILGKLSSSLVEVQNDETDSLAEWADEVIDEALQLESAESDDYDTKQDLIKKLKKLNPELGTSELNLASISELEEMIRDAEQNKSEITESLDPELEKLVKPFIKWMSQEPGASSMVKNNQRASIEATAKKFLAARGYEGNVSDAASKLIMAITDHPDVNEGLKSRLAAAGVAAGLAAAGGTTGYFAPKILDKVSTNVKRELSQPMGKEVKNRELEVPAGQNIAFPDKKTKK
jgi:hypothetical protein